MKSQSDIEELAKKDIQLRDKLVAELNACLGRIQAYNMIINDQVITDTGGGPVDDTPK